MGIILSRSAQTTNSSLSPQSSSSQLTEKRLLLHGKRTPSQQPIAFFKDPKTNTTEVLWVKGGKREKNLNFCSKGITQLNPCICQLASLETLQLCCNSLTLLPKELFLLGRLRTLSLSRNGLRRIPDELGVLTGLEEMNLSHNKITRIPKCIIKLQKLEILNLDGNCIREVPQEVGFLPLLTFLELSRNPIQFLPIEIARLTGLKKLRLQECPLMGEEKLFLSNDDIYEESSAKKKTKCFSLKTIAGIKFANQAILQSKTMKKALDEHPKFTNLLTNFLENVGECSFCHKPLFQEHIFRLRIIQRGEYHVPFAYKMCNNHWNTEEGRIKSTFSECHPHSAIRQLCLASSGK